MARAKCGGGRECGRKHIWLLIFSRMDAFGISSFLYQDKKNVMLICKCPFLQSYYRENIRPLIEVLRGKIVNLIPITPRHNATWFLIQSQEEMWKRSGGIVICLLFLFGL